MLLLFGIVMVSCSNVPSAVPDSTNIPIKIKPVKVYPLPAGTISEAAPLFNGGIWILSGSPQSKVATEYSVQNDFTIENKVFLSQYSSTIATTSGALLIVGTNTPSGDGSLNIYSGISGSKLNSVPMPGPVVAVTSVPSGNELVALIKRQQAMSVTFVNLTNYAIIKSFPVPQAAVAVSLGSDPNTIFVLLATGTVDSISVKSGVVQSELKVGNYGNYLAISNNQTRLLALKCSSSTCNISVVDTSSDEVLVALPAPAGAVAVEFSAGDDILYEIVNINGTSNFQEFYVKTFIP